MTLNGYIRSILLNLSLSNPNYMKMRKVKYLGLLILVLICFVPKLQVQSLKNKAILQAREMGDTLIARFNNKLYYTLRTNNKYTVVEGKIAFHTYNLYDTSKDIMLEYLTDKAELVKRLRSGDTIRECFMADMTLSFKDFTDVQVYSDEPVTAPPPPVVKTEKAAKHKIGAKQKVEAPKKTVAVQKHPAVRHRKKSTESVPFSKPIVFNNCVFGPIVADTMTDIYEEDARKKKRMEFKEDVIMVNCTFTEGIEIADCDFKKDFVLAGQLLSKTASLINNCEFSGMCYLYSSPELGNWQSFFNFNFCKFTGPYIFTATNSDRAHFNISQCKINDVFSFGRSVPDFISKKFRLSYSGTDYFYRLDDYTDWYSDFLENKYTKEYELDDDSIEDFAHNDRIVYNVKVSDTKIKCLDLANTNMSDCSFEDVTIEKCVDATDCSFAYSADFKGKQALEDITFPGNDGIIYAAFKTFSPEALKLGVFLQKIKIHPLVHDYFDSSTDFLEDNTNYYNLIKDYSAKKFTNDELVTSLKARYEYEKALWARSYYSAHMAHPDGFGDFMSSTFHWALGGFLEATVSTGYKGEWRFGMWVLLVILTFSSIYYFKHREAVIDYLNSMYNKDAAALASYDTLKVYKSFNRFRDFMRCFWFSCLVFVDPRLPITFFNLRVGLFGLVLAEWICGLTAILLFLVFLASNYPFIHSLIGI